MRCLYDTVEHLVPERKLKQLVFWLQPCDKVVDDDQVEGEEGAAPDVDDLQAGEGEEGQLVNLGDQELNWKQLTPIKEPGTHRHIA